MAGIVLVVIAQVMVLQNVVMEIAQVMKPMMIAQKTVCLQVNVQMDRCLIAMAVMNAGQSLGLVMALKTVKINSMAQT